MMNSPQTEAELVELHHGVNRGTPYGDNRWIATESKQPGLESMLRWRGRPQKEIENQVVQLPIHSRLPRFGGCHNFFPM